MAIRFSQPPAGSLRALDQGVRKVALVDKSFGLKVRARARAALKEGVPPDRMPHQIFTIGLDDLAAGAKRANLKLIGHRYILDPSADGGSAGEVYCDEKGKNHAFADVNFGPFTQATLQAVDALSRHPSTQADNFEFAVIRIPALYVFAAWLRHTNPAKDLVVKVDPDKPSSARAKVLRLDDFLSSLQKEAKKALKADRALVL